jgi:hypothetical protein
MISSRCAVENKFSENSRKHPLSLPTLFCQFNSYLFHPSTNTKETDYETETTSLKYTHWELEREHRHIRTSKWSGMHDEICPKNLNKFDNIYNFICCL